MLTKFSSVESCYREVEVEVKNFTNHAHSLPCPFNPLLPHLFLVGEASSEQLQEEPLSPLVVLWRTGRQLLHRDRHTEGPFHRETCSSTTGVFGSLTARELITR